MKKNIVIVALSCVALASSFALYTAAPRQAPNRVARFSEEEQKALTEAFKGVTTDGRVIPGLFKIKSTGVSTVPVREAAEAFLNGLSEPQRQKTLYPVDDSEWRKWDNRHFPPRQGVAFKEMSERQRGLAFALVGASLSARGLQKTTDIMKLNETLAELANNFDEYGQWLYWVTVMGQPSDTEPWGWQLDGHHCIINYFVLGDQVVMTPTFMGSEPVRAESGKFKGTVVMQDEQNKGLKLFLSLNKDEQAKAIIRSEKGSVDSLAQAYKDNLVLSTAGVSAAGMTEPQQKLLLELMAEYIGNMKDGHARVKMDEVRQHLDRTHFAWIGGTDSDGVFYYRIQSPVILIEFDHQARVAPVRSQTPTRDHIHTVVRTPNGNDYGKDLLRQHHERHRHGGGRDHLKGR
ncbi:MAG: DUF3500 domain-containing protein [Pyrinomonadaceae bacterium]